MYYRLVTTDSNHKKQVAPNLLAQDFSAKEPNQKWVSDITWTGVKNEGIWDIGIKNC